MVGGNQPAPVVPQHAGGVPSLRVVSGQAAHFPLSNRSFGRQVRPVFAPTSLYHFGWCVRARIRLPRGELPTVDVLRILRKVAPRRPEQPAAV
jgi:hypothetical protein